MHGDSRELAPSPPLPRKRGRERTEFAAGSVTGQERVVPFNTLPHFSSIARASASESAEVGGNLSIQGNGRQASMITFECEVMPRALSAAGMRGSSAELQALRTMSICSDGSQRVATAHMTSARLPQMVAARNGSPK